ncbi:MAG: hypothetical protein HQL52_19965 [Magnetococcales bacterium]|nr:hypothetical protein [Magnetococcales bacterium]
MADKNEPKQADIERELAARQKFSLAGAIGRQARGAMKGASPIPRGEQAVLTINHFIDQHLSDPSGALKSILKRRIKAQEMVLQKHLENPLAALQEILHALLDQEGTLQEFVRRVDVRWGELYQERPHFQQPGAAAHPDDEYTHQSVRRDLEGVLERIIKLE